MKKTVIHCPYCGSKATLHPSSFIYGEAAKTDGYVYVCGRYPECDSYVGAHIKSKQPMGTLANGDLRNKRIKAHKAFDRMWKSSFMTKYYAYKWMEIKFGLDSNQAHALYHDELTTCDNIAEASRGMNSCRSVLKAVSNLLLRRQIILERV